MNKASHRGFQFLVMAMTLTSLAAQGSADEKSAAIQLEVAADNWTGTRLQGLPVGGSLRFEAIADGPVTIILLDEGGYAAFPDRTKALFRQGMEGRLSAELALPAAGDYFLIADNRRNAEQRTVTLNMTVRSPAHTSSQELGEQMQVLVKRMEQVFEMRGLALHLEPCEKPDLALHDRTVTVCTEYVDLLVRSLEDRQLARDALLFSLLVTIGRDWIAAAGNGADAGDPHMLGAALMILFNQTEAAEKQARHFATMRSGDDALAELTARPDHPLHSGAAQRVQSAIGEPDALVAGHASLILERMKLDVLAQMPEAPPGWTTREQITAEMERRGAP